MVDVKAFSEIESLSEYDWIESSNFFNEYFFFNMYFLIKLIDWINPSISVLIEISFVSLEIFELISITTVPPLASKYSPSRVTDL